MERVFADAEKAMILDDFWIGSEMTGQSNASFNKKAKHFNMLCCGFKMKHSKVGLLL